MNRQRPHTSITRTRRLVRDLLTRERASAAPRDLVLFALDGLPGALAERRWPAARTMRMRSVFPTTSSAGWLSSITGQSVAQHRVPGVVFTLGDWPDHDLINVFDYRGSELTPGRSETIFTDAVSRGYHARAIPSDLEQVECAWQDELLRGAQRTPGYRFYPMRDGVYQARAAKEICADVRAAVTEARQGNSPCLVWCFIEMDRHVHEHGYDEHVNELLTGINDYAQELSDDGAIAVAHSDHGLVPTSHDLAVADILGATRTRFHCAIGGAGRTRWVYSPPTKASAIEAELRSQLPKSIRVLHASQIFPAAIRSRIGSIVLIANESAFLTEPGYRYDHGSATDTELDVPFSVWGAQFTGGP